MIKIMKTLWPTQNKKHYQLWMPTRSIPHPNLETTFSIHYTELTKIPLIITTFLSPPSNTCLLSSHTTTHSPIFSLPSTALGGLLIIPSGNVLKILLPGCFNSKTNDPIEVYMLTRYDDGKIFFSFFCDLFFVWTPLQHFSPITIFSSIFFRHVYKTSNYNRWYMYLPWFSIQTTSISFFLAFLSLLCLLVVVCLLCLCVCLLPYTESINN